VDESGIAQLDAAVRDEVAVWGEVRPPYLAFPDIDPLDIGWRMGAGEWHIMVWSHWWDSSHPNEAGRLGYFRRHPPPAAWTFWVAAAIWPEQAEDIDDEDDIGPAVRRLAEHGIGST